MKTFKQKLEEIVESVWLDFGSIHARGKEITHKDLDNIKYKKVDQIISLFLEDVIQEDEKNHLTTYDAIGRKSGRNNLRQEMRKVLNEKQNTKMFTL